MCKNCSECQKHVLPRVEFGIFMFWTCNSMNQKYCIFAMNNLSSYCGLVDAEIRASKKDLPVKTRSTLKNLSGVSSLKSEWRFKNANFDYWRNLDNMPLGWFLKILSNWRCHHMNVSIWRKIFLDITFFLVLQILFQRVADTRQLAEPSQEIFQVSIQGA